MEDEVGMTDMQFKVYLMEQLENWQRVLDIAIKHDDKEIREEAERQIAKINNGLNL